MMIENLGLSLSMVCSADCVYCPRPHARRSETPFMNLKLVDKILTESKVYHIRSIDVGENGDAFLNPEIIPILRLIRSKSNAVIRMFTNFRNFGPELIDAVLGERLLDKVITNIDGATPEAYSNIKGLRLGRVEENILRFLARNKELESPVQFRIQALTLNHYVSTVRRVLGRNPTHVPEHLLDTADDFEAIVARWRPRGIVPVRSVVTLWAENPEPETNWGLFQRTVRRVRRRLRPKPCRMLATIRRGFLVAPSGKVYLCCADFNCELVIGDLTRQSVQEVVQSDIRRELIAKLERREFDSVGGPCRTSELCRIYR